MKIILISFLKLEDLPPIVSLIKSASERYDVVYIGINEPCAYYQKLFGKRVMMVNIDYSQNTRRLAQKSRTFRFVINRLRSFIYGLRAEKKVAAHTSTQDIVWVLHEYTLVRLPQKFFNRNFNLTLYELNQALLSPRKSAVKAKIAAASKIVVPEYCRAAIVQACLGLKDLPAILPNKPFDYSEEEMYLADNPLATIAEQAHSQGKKVVLYSGIFLRERKLNTIIEAVLKNKDLFEMVLIGQRSDYLDELLNLYPDVKYGGFTRAPKHLSMIRYADIGILTYVADSGSINPVFCAPNKTWEYAMFGIPMLCNDIPGLRYTVEYNNMGCCCDINSVTNIEEKLIQILSEHDKMSSAATAYYHGLNIADCVSAIIRDHLESTN